MNKIKLSLAHLVLWWSVAMLLLLAVGMMLDEARAHRAVRFFEMLKHADGQFYNQPFVLLPWEKQIIRDVYGTVKEDGSRQYKYIYIEIPKKNGKSELAAGAALYHLFADGEHYGEIYGCAADRKQAKIVYEVAKKMIRLVPSLDKRARVTDSLKMITDRYSGSVYEVLSSEAFTKHGFKTSACIFDELHAQPNRDLWDVMTYEAGATRRQPIWWIITTAGDDPDRTSVCWEQHEYALSILSGEIVDPTWYVTIFNYDGDDIYNEANWFKANPSLGPVKSLESMREAAETAKKKPANERLFRWLDLNQWITTKLTTWLPLSLWDKTVGKWSRADLLGKDCYLGMDLSSTTDMTSVCALFPPQGEQLDWRCFWHIWIPEENMQERVRNDKVPYDKWVAAGHVTATPGNVVDYTEVEKTILEINKFYKVIELPSDRAFAAMLLQRLEQSGMVSVDIPQTFKMMTGPMNLVEVLLKKAAGQSTGLGESTRQDTELLEKQLAESLGIDPYKMLQAGLTHEDNLAAKWAFGNASIAKNGNEEIKLVKEHRGKSVVRTKRIDPITALVNAMARGQFYKGSVDISAQILSEDWGM
jgi:phage terminase large subunit-like protein